MVEYLKGTWNHSHQMAHHDGPSECTRKSPKWRSLCAGEFQLERRKWEAKRQLTEQVQYVTVEPKRERAGSTKKEKAYSTDFILFKPSRSTLLFCFTPPTMAPVAASPTPVAVPLPVLTPTTAPKDKKAAARKRFEAVYTVVRDDLLADFRKHNMPEEAIEYYRRVRTPTTCFPLIPSP